METTHQAAPLFLAEMAPPRWRGSLTAGYQFFLALGVLIANLVNYATAHASWGWRVSLGRMATRREYRPHLVLAVAVPMFFQLTGVIVLAFFAPLVFRTVGFGSRAALMGAVVLGAVNLGSLVLSTFVIDRYGRKVLFMAGGVQMVVCQVAIAWIMGAKIGNGGEAAMAHPYAVAVLVFTCLHTAGFGWSWGPLGWVIPSEIFPVDIRSAGQAMNVSIGLCLTFVQTQSFLAMLCRFKYATFAYYAAWVAVMTIFIALFLPETKGIPLESMGTIWVKHWYWKRFVHDGKQSNVALT